MAYIKPIVCLLACCTLLGCSAVSTEPEKVNIEPVACITPDLRATQPLLLIQNIHAKYMDIHSGTIDKEVTFDAYLSSNAKELKLSVLFMGFRAWDIHYNGEMIFEERASQVPEQLQAQYLIRDITLSYWPAKSITRQNKNFKIIEQANERLVQDQQSGETLLTIHYDNQDPVKRTTGRIVLTNHKEHYQLIIDSREP